METQGGSAVDAAIAAMLCTGVVSMHSAGIGGGALAVIYNKSSPDADRVKTFDFREKAPAAASEDMFVGSISGKTRKSDKGGLAIAVPGEIKGYKELHERYGRLPWAKLFEPAIKMCKDGFPLAYPVEKAIKQEQRSFLKEVNYTPLRNMLLHESGRYLRAGETMKLPKLAETLGRIAEGGSDVFYFGDLADDIVADLQEQGSIITKEDLQNYTVALRAPLKSNIGEYSMFTMPPPSSGAIVQYLFNIIKGYNFTSSNIATNETNILTYHRLIEAMKYAYAKQSEMGDSDFVDVTELLSHVTSEKYGESIRQKINDDKTFPPKHYGAHVTEHGAGTTHISVIDPDGNAVSLTSTIDNYFGSGVVGKRTGILFNDQMDDFSTPGSPNHFGVPPSEANSIRPGKRPMSSMAPCIVVDKQGNIKMVVGAAGANRIPTSTFMAILRVLVFDQKLGDAIDDFRVHHQLVPDVINSVKEFPQVLQDGLRRKGHKFQYEELMSVVQAILKDGQDIFAVADDRKKGMANGF